MTHAFDQLEILSGSGSPGRCTIRHARADQLQDAIRAALELAAQRPGSQRRTFPLPGGREVLAPTFLCSDVAVLESLLGGLMASRRSGLAVRTGRESVGVVLISFASVLISVGRISADLAGLISPQKDSPRGAVTGVFGGNADEIQVRIGVDQVAGVSWRGALFLCGGGAPPIAFGEWGRSVRQWLWLRRLRGSIDRVHGARNVPPAASPELAGEIRRDARGALPVAPADDATPQLDRRLQLATLDARVELLRRRLRQFQRPETPAEQREHEELRLRYLLDLAALNRFRVTDREIASLIDYEKAAKIRAALVGLAGLKPEDFRVAGRVSYDRWGSAAR